MPKINIVNKNYEIKSNEVISRTKRHFSAQEKLRIIKEVDECKRGEVGKILRREGIYSSYISDWRRQLNLYGVSGLSGRRISSKRGELKESEMKKLKRRNVKLEHNLKIAHALLELQKKTFEILELKDTSEESIL